MLCHLLHRSTALFHCLYLLSHSGRKGWGGREEEGEVDGENGGYIYLGGSVKRRSGKRYNMEDKKFIKIQGNLTQSSLHEQSHL